MLSLVKNSTLKYSRHTMWCLVIVVVLAILTSIWFAVFRYRSFMGDDLFLITGAQSGGYASSFWNALTASIGQKYRPIFALFFRLEFLIFGNDFRSYVFLNIFLEFVCACLVALVCYKLSRRNFFMSCVSGVLFIVSRFSYYNVLQVYGGSMAGLALVFFLLMIIATIHAYETRNPVSLTWPLLFYLLSIFTYEGYMVVGGFLLLAILLAPTNYRSLYQRIGITFAPVLILLFNYFLKTVVLHVRFFEGTGGQAISFDLSQFLHFMFTGSANMIGFNAGPNYLSGLSVSNAGKTGFAIGGFFALSLMALLIVFIATRFKSRSKTICCDARNILLVLSLFIPLLASASITFRQEFRWLYAPYIVVIFTVAYFSGRIHHYKWLNVILIICILASACTVDTFYRGYINNLAFIDGERVADSARDNIIDKYGSSLSQQQLFFIGAEDGIKSWYFGKNLFFNLYTGDQAIHMNYVDSVEEIRVRQIEPDGILVFSFDPMTREVIDVTQSVRESLVDPARLSYLNQPAFDFIKHFLERKLNNAEKVSTPDEKSVFVTNWPGKLGNSKTITIISGFSYTFEGIPVKEGDCLSFRSGIPYEASDGARAYIDIDSENGELKRLFEAELSPATEEGIQWESSLIPLGDYEGLEVTISFGVDSPSGNMDADWVAFDTPLILSPKSGAD